MSVRRLRQQIETSLQVGLFDQQWLEMDVIAAPDHIPVGGRLTGQH